MALALVLNYTTNTICAGDSSFTVVLDAREGRRIISPSANAETVKSLLDTIRAGNYKIALYAAKSGRVQSGAVVGPAGFELNYFDNLGDGVRH